MSHRGARVSGADSLLAPVRAPFRALAATFVPEAGDLDEEGWREVEGVVGEALSRRPRGMRRQVLLLIRLLDWAPVFRFRRRFRSLGSERRLRLLERLQDGPILLLRRGIWGLRTLVFLGYYARPAAYREIGYRAHPDGWEARPEAGA